MISPTTGFAGGTPCVLRQGVPEEISKLNTGTYDYDSDSDLEEDVAMDGQEKEKGSEPEDIPEA